MPGFASKSYPESLFYKVVVIFRRSSMALFDFARAGAVRQPMAPSSVNHLTLPNERVRSRAGLGAPGTLLVLMGVGIGVLTIRFILVFAHTVLQ
jgi:hypothetical protein